jgi:hypothetical protein
MQPLKSLALVIAIAPFVAIGASSTTGCSSDVENTGSSESELQTPIPLFRSVASQDAARELNVHEWRVHRGKHEYVVTGYDPTGHAISGFAIGAYAHTDVTPSHMRVRMLDGTHHSIRPVFDGDSVVTGTMSPKTEKLISHALSDFSAIGGSSSNDQSLVLHGGAGGGIHPLGTSSVAGGSSACTTVLMSTIQDAIQCGTAISKTTNNNISAATVAECLKAAGDLLQLDSACQGVLASLGGQTPGATTAGVATGGSPIAGLPTAAGSASSSGKSNAGLPSLPGTPSGQIDAAGSDQNCASCPYQQGAATTDIVPNQNNGGVSLGGDTGGDNYAQ